MSASKEAARRLQSFCLWMPDGWHYDPPYYESKHGPGQILERFCSPELRALFRELKSDDIRNVYISGLGAAGVDVPNTQVSRVVAECFLSRNQSHILGLRRQHLRMLLKFDREVLGKEPIYQRLHASRVV